MRHLLAQSPLQLVQEVQSHGAVHIQHEHILCRHHALNAFQVHQQHALPACARTPDLHSMPSARKQAQELTSVCTVSRTMGGPGVSCPGAHRTSAHLVSSRVSRVTECNRDTCGCFPFQVYACWLWTKTKEDIYFDTGKREATLLWLHQTDCHRGIQSVSLNVTMQGTEKHLQSIAEGWIWVSMGSRRRRSRECRFSWAVSNDRSACMHACMHARSLWKTFG